MRHRTTQRARHERERHRERRESALGPEAGRVDEDEAVHEARMAPDDVEQYLDLYRRTIRDCRD